MECVCFTLIVDDIVLPHGETVMEVLGGGGPQSLFGYQLVTNQSAAVGLSAGVGPDLPRRCREWLESIGADTSGLVPYQRPTPRAWQVFEEWGRRTQIWRGRDDPCEELYDMLRPKYDTMPPHFRAATNYHLGLHPLHPPHRLMEQLRQAAHANGGVLSVEPYTSAESPPSVPAQLTALLALCDVFSPNREEAESIVGPGSPEEVALRLLALSPAGGADVVVVRCGAEGVLLARRTETGPQPSAAAADDDDEVVAAAGEGGSMMVEAYRVPAVEDTAVVDVTGCGNAFCGGFLAALYRGAAGRGPPTPPTTPIAMDGHASGENDGTRVSGSGSGGGGGNVRAAATERRPPSPSPPSSPSSPPPWVRSGDLRLAGSWGCVAASFMAEERGVPTTRVADLQERAAARLEALLPRVQPVQLARAALRREAACNIMARCGSVQERPSTTCRPLAARTTCVMRAFKSKSSLGFTRRTVRV